MQDQNYSIMQKSLKRRIKLMWLFQVYVSFESFYGELFEGQFNVFYVICIVLHIYFDAWLEKVDLDLRGDIVLGDDFLMTWKYRINAGMLNFFTLNIFLLKISLHFVKIKRPFHALFTIFQLKFQLISPGKLREKWKFKQNWMLGNLLHE